VVGILSPDAVASRNVKNEWDWAIQNDKRLLLLQVKPTIIPHRYVSINFIDASDADPAPALSALVNTLGVTPADDTVPETRYARIDDLNIAYQVLGDGPIDLVYCFGFASNIEVIWEEPRYARYLRRLASFSRLILFDKRGMGASDRISYVPTLDDRQDDVRAVMDAVGSERAALMGGSEGVPLAILFAATFPERVSKLILYGGCACGVQKPDYPAGSTPEQNERDLANVRAHWGDESWAERFAPSETEERQFTRWLARMCRLSASPRDAEALFIYGQQIDVRRLLPTIRAPTLVLHRTGDRVCLIDEGRYVAEHISGARFVELPGDDHMVILGDQDVVVDEVEAFLAKAM
jgi:pimeloyl-ACP methyl ester carboxylesterase